MLYPDCHVPMGPGDPIALIIVCNVSGEKNEMQDLALTSCDNRRGLQLQLDLHRPPKLLGQRIRILLQQHRRVKRQSRLLA